MQACDKCGETLLYDASEEWFRSGIRWSLNPKRPCLYNVQALAGNDKLWKCFF